MAVTPGSSSVWLAHTTIGTLSDAMAGHVRPSGDESPVGMAGPSRPYLDFRAAVAAFASAWERGETRAVDEFLRRLDPDDSQAAVELIYREFCLAEAAGWNPDPAVYAARFPQHKPALERLLSLHGECTASLLGRWVNCPPAEPELPEAGDAIGPYVLRRELGRGSFARVYLAEQTDLENRLVVLKVSTRVTREPWLLARARHAHIVEIVSHASVDDGALHLICMPFFGGATLAAVLEARAKRATAASSGRDFLADLDAVAAAEYPTVHPARPAREILAGLTYDQSLAWVGARLAEALDHAFGRSVAHGDVKPSNILLSADGNPMLLDFNLARDAAQAGSADGGADLGGTLAYMAPERLAAIAAADQSDDVWYSSAAASALCTARVSSEPIPRAEGSSTPDRAPHLADIYALGMVLLESLTGKAPVQPALDGISPGSRRQAVQSTAGELAAARGLGARAVIAAAETAGRRAVTPGLRVILERCLQPRPAERYARAWELAEDLDRWRTHRPLAFTAEPFWGLTVPRRLRRSRRVIVTAALALGIAAVTAIFVMARSDQTLQAIALAKLARHIDDPDAYRFQRSTKDWLADYRQGLVSFQPARSNDSQTVEGLLRTLNDYGVLGSGDWRARPEVRLLPDSDRDDLELWLSEQAYRYCRALADRPDSPADWRRAVAVLDRVSAGRSIDAFTALCRRLNSKLDAALGPQSPAAPRGSTPPTTATAPAWLNVYLAGVASDCGAVASETSGDRVSSARRRDLSQALLHYGELLVLKPDSYWGHYRIAAISYALGRFADTALHLEKCLERRPDNATLRGQRAACLAWLERFPEALEECDRALDGAPDLAELFRTRAFIRAASGQAVGLPDDIRHFEVLSHRLPRAFWGDRAPAGSRGLGPMFWPVTPLASTSFARLQHRTDGSEFEPVDDDAEVDPEELNARAVLAHTIVRAGEPELALAELSKILALDQHHVAARMTRALLSIETGRFDDASRDLDIILDHPGLSAYLREDPTFILRFHDATRAFAERGKVASAQLLAQRTLERAAARADHPASRLLRALIEIDARQFELAQRDIDSVLGEGGPGAYLRQYPAMFAGLHELTRSYLRQGNATQARLVARRVLDRAIKLSLPRAPAHFSLARAYAACARIEPALLVEAADQLYHASYAHSEYLQNFERDPLFDAMRARLTPMLAEMPAIHRLPDPTAEYRRRFATVVTQGP